MYLFFFLLGSVVSESVADAGKTLKPYIYSQRPIQTSASSTATTSQAEKEQKKPINNSLGLKPLG